MFRTLRYFGPFYNTDGGAGSGGSGDGGAGGGAGDGGKDLEYLRAEAKKAFADRDAAKARAKELEGKLPTEEQLAKWKELETQAEQAEEERKRKAGEFDGWRQQVAEKHAKELKDRDAKVQAEADAKAGAIKDLHSTLIGLAFAAAGDLFGAEGKTVLTPDIAQAYFGKHVEVKDENGSRSVIVKDLHGNEIIDTKTGKPMPFDKAIGELIDAMPNKDRILRGSGKAGSGNSGGSSHNTGPLDLDAVTRRASQGDKEAIAILKKRRSSGGMVQGTAWEK